MFKFFRKIRHNLLAERKLASLVGRFSRYLLYASGEITLVVIGILLTLQMNTWNQDRLSKQMEKAI